MKLLTYNCWNGFEQEDGASFYEAVRWMKTQDFDVACFQEMTFRFHQQFTQAQFERHLKQELGLVHVAYGNAGALYAESSFYGQITCSRVPWTKGTKPISLALRADPVLHEKRNALFVQLANGVSICNTHLDVWDRTGNTRLAQLQDIHQVLTQHKMFPTVLCGDLNTVRRADYTTAQWQLLTQHWTIESKSLDWLQSLGLSDTFTHLGRQAENTHRDAAKRIDFIIPFDPRQQLTVVDSKTYHVEFSDHYPVMAEFALRDGEVPAPKIPSWR
jgi:endonuclease/exonuclease/phosphatase family metal-dependent hydrolase